MGKGEGNVLTLDSLNFEEQTRSGKILVDFYADWCGPCRMLAPLLEKVAEKYVGKVRFAKLNVEGAEKIASQFEVYSVPTLILMQDGKLLGTLVGMNDEATLHQFVQSLLV